MPKDILKCGIKINNVYKPVTVKLPKDLEISIREYLSVRHCLLKGRKDNGYLFLNSQGTEYTSNSLNPVIKMLSKKHLKEYSPVPPHLYRDICVSSWKRFDKRLNQVYFDYFLLHNPKIGSNANYEHIEPSESVEIGRASCRERV